eukprot:312839-Prymnesium_polylepis.1
MDEYWMGPLHTRLRTTGPTGRKHTGQPHHGAAAHCPTTLGATAHTGPQHARAPRDAATRGARARGGGPHLQAVHEPKLGDEVGLQHPLPLGVLQRVLAPRGALVVGEAARDRLERL